jgi:hypothetical protein
MPISRWGIFEKCDTYAPQGTILPSKEGSLASCDNMFETEKSYAKLNKPGVEDQTLHENKCVMNLK